MLPPTVRRVIIFIEERLYVRRRPLEQQHQEPGGLLRQILVQVLEPVSDERDVLPGLDVVGAPERRHAGQQCVRDHPERPDVRVRIRGLVA